MTYTEAVSALEKLERSPRDVESESHVRLVKEFIWRARHYRTARGMSMTTAFIETSEVRERIPELPPDVERRLIAWVESNNLGLTVLESCRTYLRFALAADPSISVSDEAYVYQPLIRVLEEGGRFERHHGDVCVSGATVILNRD